MNAGKRAAVVGVTVIGVVIGVVVVVGVTLRPVLTPLTQRTPLSPAAQMTDAGVPVPRSAQQCPVQGRTSAGSVRWCMPAGVSAATVHQWYLDALPPGRDAGALRWCTQEQHGDGRLSAVWSTRAGLIGYILPPQPPRPLYQELDNPVAVEVLALAGSACHPVTRATRERA